MLSVTLCPERLVVTVTPDLVLVTVSPAMAFMVTFTCARLRAVTRCPASSFCRRDRDVGESGAYAPVHAAV